MSGPEDTYHAMPFEARASWEPHLYDLACRIEQLKTTTTNPATGKPYTWNDLGDAVGNHLAAVAPTVRRPGRTYMWLACRQSMYFAVEWVEALSSIFGIDFDGLAGSAKPYLLPGYAMSR